MAPTAGGALALLVEAPNYYRFLLLTIVILLLGGVLLLRGVLLRVVLLLSIIALTLRRDSGIRLGLQLAVLICIRRLVMDNREGHVLRRNARIVSIISNVQSVLLVVSFDVAAVNRQVF